MYGMVAVPASSETNNRPTISRPPHSAIFAASGVSPPEQSARGAVMPKTKKQAEPLAAGSPTFVATFADGEVTRMTVFCPPDDVDVERGKKLARYAYESRTKKTPPAFLKAHFEHAGVVFKAYSAV